MHRGPARAILILALFLWPHLVFAEGGVQQELLRGVRAFRGERYEESLSIFHHLQEKGQVPEIGFYLGTTLHKLGRDVEALAAFRAARRAGLQEPLIDYYQAVSCYRLGMFARARRAFVALRSPTAAVGGAQRPVVGPRLQAGAQRFVSAIDDAVGKVPIGERFDAVLRRAQAVLPGGPGEGLEWLDEAVQMLPQQRDKVSRLRQLLSQLGKNREYMDEAALLQRSMETRAALRE